MRHRVILSSELYGDEEFVYDSFQKAMAGVRRLSRSARESYHKDGVERRVSYVIEDVFETEDKVFDAMVRYIAALHDDTKEANSTLGAHPTPPEMDGGDNIASPRTESHTPVA